MSLPELFRLFLKTKGFSPVTTKNYVGDVVHFLNWLKEKTGIDYRVAGEGLFGLFTPETVKEYKNDQISQGVSLATVNRRLSGLRQLAQFGLGQGWLKTNSTKNIFNATTNDLHKPQKIPEVLAGFRKHLIGEKISPLTIKNYLSDVRHFLNHQTSFEDYQQWLTRELQLSPATVKRRLSSIRHFCEWSESLSPIQDRRLKPTAHPSPIVRAYEAYQSISITKYLHYAILIVFCAALGFGAYDQFFRKAPTPLAYPTALTAPNRYLSFQGRLTDSSSNPISSATNMHFRLYNNSSGGTTLWDSSPSYPTGACVVSPDQDGIFSILLGSGCGGAIDASVFSENANVWVGITVANEVSEMTPRIQIATVGYALNAETLQGFPASPSATENTIPVVNNSGDLIIGSFNPTLQSTSGTFAIEGLVGLTLQTATNGNITLAPNGSGVLNLTLSAPNGNVISATDALLGTSGQKEENTLVYGSVANANTNLNLLKLEAGSSPVPKFTVDTAGNASAAGILKALTTGSYFTGDITVSGGDITGTGSVSLDIGEADANYITSSVGYAVGGASTYYINSSGTGNLNALTLAGDLTIDTDDLFVDTSENKIGLGTTTLTERLTVSGNATISGTLALAPNIPGDAGTCDATAKGKQYYNGTDNKMYYCNGSAWTVMSGSAGGVGGSGTQNYLPKWSDGTTLADSVIYETGGQIGIGTTDPSSKLEVNGDIELTNLLDNDATNFFDGGCTGTQTISGIDSTGAITCTSITGVPAASVPFSGITSATNTTAAMVVGTGGSLDYSTTGTINASSLQGATWGAPLGIGSTTPGSGAFTTLSSTGITAIGNNSATVAIDSSDWNIGTTGDMTGIGSITMDGSFSQTGAGTFGTGTGAVSLNGDTTIASGKNLTLTQGNITLSSGLLTQTGAGNNSFAGNVGIGTTNPVQKLHVEGQCITGDSLLSTTQGSIPIKDIKLNTYVYSLNEETGKIVPAKINGLLDMGVKPVFKLTTGDGKTIRTTGNHPYLVRQLVSNPTNNQTPSNEGKNGAYNNQPIHNLSFLSDQNIDENNNNGRQERTPSQSSSYIHYLTPSDIFNEDFIKNPVQATDKTPDLAISVNSFPVSSGAMIPAANQATPKFRQNSANNFLWVPESSFTKNSLTNDYSFVKPNEGIWAKVIYLRPGMEIAVAKGEQASWAKIASIEYVGEEQVYDIEVEGTHNFIANGILAHNTYLSGNVGIGTTGPLASLDVGGEASVSGNLTLAGGARSIVGTAMNALTLGDASTGDLQFYSASNKLTSAGALTLASTITANTTDTINGLSISSASLTDAVNITLTGYIDMATSQWLGLASDAGRFVFTDAGTDLIDVETANLDINTNTLAGGTAVIDFTNFDVATTGHITVQPAYGLDTNASGELKLGDTTATTVSLGTTAATILNIGATQALTRAINIGTGTGVDTINIGIGATGADVINIGSANAGNVTIKSNAILNLTGSTNSLIDFPNFDVDTGGDAILAGYIDMATAQWIGLASNAGRFVFTDAATDIIDVETANLDLNANIITNIGNAGTDFDTDGGLILAGDLRLNSNQIRNSSGTASIILSSATTTTANQLDTGNWLINNTTNLGEAALIVDQNKGGAIFTASASGSPKFTITNAGNVGIGTISPETQLHLTGNLRVGGGYLDSTGLSSSDKTWTTTADFNAGAFSAGMLNPATNNELKLGL